MINIPLRLDNMQILAFAKLKSADDFTVYYSEEDNIPEHIFTYIKYNLNNVNFVKTSFDKLNLDVRLPDFWPTKEQLDSLSIYQYVSKDNYEKIVSQTIDQKLSGYVCYDLTDDIIELIKMITDKDVIKLNPGDKLPFITVYDKL